MTRAERLKLAKAARELAMECVAGTAPAFRTESFWINNQPGCAMGHVVARVGVRSAREASAVYMDCPVDSRREVTIANDEQPDALPWTLLALADELEAAP